MLGIEMPDPFIFGAQPVQQPGEKSLSWWDQLKIGLVTVFPMSSPQAVAAKAAAQRPIRTTGPRLTYKPTEPPTIDKTPDDLVTKVMKWLLENPDAGIAGFFSDVFILFDPCATASPQTRGQLGCQSGPTM